MKRVRVWQYSLRGETMLSLMAAGVCKLVWMGAQTRHTMNKYRISKSTVSYIVNKKTYAEV
jgi:hypothetical protein